ncbi:MAG: hypothetical protein ACK2UW_08595 [Anaerolineales bacterium]|jgi:hypothetical protein
MNGADSERQAVLRMISEGQVSSEEGSRLLSSLGWRKPSVIADRPAAAQYSSPRWFRVRVSDIHTGRTRVSVNLPFAMVRWGISLGAQFVPEVDEINLRELADLLEQGYSGKLIDVVDEVDGEHVEIFVE